MQRSHEWKRTFFWIAVISLIASMPYLCGYHFTAEDLPELYGIVLNTATAGISYVCFGRMFRNRVTGIICSALYTLSVYRIYRLMVICSVREGTAIAFLPLVLYGLYRIFAGNPDEKGYGTSWVPFLTGTVGIVLSHVPTFGITVVVTALFCAACMRKMICRKTFLALLKGTLPSLAVSLWFLVPFHADRLVRDAQGNRTSFQAVQSRGISFAQLTFHFWTAGPQMPGGDSGGQYSDPAGIGLILTAALGIFLILWFSGRFQGADGENVLFAKKTAVIGLILLVMSMNIFPWDRIQAFHPAIAALISGLQYPYHLLGWGTACMVSVFGACLRYFENSAKRQLYWAMAAAAVMGIVTSGMYLLEYVSSVRSLLSQ